MKIKKKKTRRSDFKVHTKEGRALKFLRESRKLSMRKAAAVLNTSEAFVNHSENGRLDLTMTTILKFLKGYGYEFEYFKKIVDGKIEIPSNDFEDCVAILKRVAPEKLKTIKNILQSF